MRSDGGTVVAASLVLVLFVDLGLETGVLCGGASIGRCGTEQKERLARQSTENGARGTLDERVGMD